MVQVYYAAIENQIMFCEITFLLYHTKFICELPFKVILHDDIDS